MKIDYSKKNMISLLLIIRISNKRNIKNLVRAEDLVLIANSIPKIINKQNEIKESLLWPSSKGPLKLNILRDSKIQELNQNNVPPEWDLKFPFKTMHRYNKSASNFNPKTQKPLLNTKMSWEKLNGRNAHRPIVNHGSIFVDKNLASTPENNNEFPVCSIKTLTTHRYACNFLEKKQSISKSTNSINHKAKLNLVPRNNSYNHNKRVKWYNNRPRKIISEYYRYNYTENIESKQKMPECRNDVIHKIGKLFNKNKRGSTRRLAAFNIEQNKMCKR